MTRRGWLLLGAVVLLCLATLWGVRQWRGPQVEVVALRAAPLVRTLQFSARVTTLSRVDVGSTITGRVAQVRVREGEQVRRGDVLLELEAQETHAAWLQAQASQHQAQARLEGLQTTGRGAAQALLMQAQAQLEIAQSQWQRAQQLRARGFYSPAQLDEAQRALKVAQAQRDSADSQWQANTGTELAQAQAQAVAARAATAAAQARWEQTSLRAPADGRVLQRNVEPGQIVQPGKALLGMALAGPVRLVAQVDERFLEQLQVGQPATVVADAFASQRFAAQVLSIAPVVDAQRGAIEVKLALSGPAPAHLREDMTLSVEVETARRERAWVLPVAALRAPMDAAQASVLVVEDGYAQPRTVRLGLRTLEAVEVLDGLREGELVVRSTANTLPASRVRPQVVQWQPRSSALSAGRADDAGAAMTQSMGR